ncbi:MAG: hypothetical protein IBJ18_05335 [Phycisphaerales bacterium]|nr:hypothetical protein [Phycisphaerales bacterium]
MASDALQPVLSAIARAVDRGGTQAAPAATQATNPLPTLTAARLDGYINPADEAKDRNNRLILDVVDKSLERSAKLREEATKRRDERRAEEARREESRAEREANEAAAQAAADQRRAVEAQRQQRRDERDSLLAEIEARRNARGLNVAA